MYIKKNREGQRGQLSTNLDWETGFGTFTALIAVKAIAEGPNARRGGCKSQIVVHPLAEDGEHEGELTIALYVGIGGA